MLSVSKNADACRITVKVKATRDEINALFSVFEANAERCNIPEPPPSEPPVEEKEEVPVGRVFIGHGRNNQWKALKDHLQDKHHFEISNYEVGSRAGHSARDILEEMLDESAVALLVMTGEDKTAKGKARARQNVVHETGLFQGKLGFSKAIVLREDGTEPFSNLAGIEEIRFPRGKIKESFGDVVAFLNRELNLGIRDD
jgi:predicted nucleotide-binding protein